MTTSFYPLTIKISILYHHAHTSLKATLSIRSFIHSLIPLYSFLPHHSWLYQSPLCRVQPPRNNNLLRSLLPHLTIKLPFNYSFLPSFLNTHMYHLHTSSLPVHYTRLTLSIFFLDTALDTTNIRDSMKLIQDYTIDGNQTQKTCFSLSSPSNNTWGLGYAC